jgi:hypothetical protein
MKWLLYHPRDAVIPLEASLYHAVVKEGAQVNALRMPGEIDGHNRPLTSEEMEWHMDMAAKALLPRPRERLVEERVFASGRMVPGIDVERGESDEASLLQPPPFTTVTSEMTNQNYGGIS